MLNMSSSKGVDPALIEYRFKGLLPNPVFYSYSFSTEIIGAMDNLLTRIDNTGLSYLTFSFTGEAPLHLAFSLITCCMKNQSNFRVLFL